MRNWNNYIHALHIITYFIENVLSWLHFYRSTLLFTIRQTICNSWNLFERPTRTSDFFTLTSISIVFLLCGRRHAAQKTAICESSHQLLTFTFTNSHTRVRLCHRASAARPTNLLFIYSIFFFSFGSCPFQCYRHIFPTVSFNGKFLSSFFRCCIRCDSTITTLCLLWTGFGPNKHHLQSNV